MERRTPIFMRERPPYTDFDYRMGLTEPFTGHLSHFLSHENRPIPLYRSRSNIQSKEPPLIQRHYKPMYSEAPRTRAAWEGLDQCERSRKMRETAFGVDDIPKSGNRTDRGPVSCFHPPKAKDPVPIFREPPHQNNIGWRPNLQSSRSWNEKGFEKRKTTADPIQQGKLSMFKEPPKQTNLHWEPVSQPKFVGGPKDKAKFGSSTLLNAQCIPETPNYDHGAERFAEECNNVWGTLNPNDAQEFDNYQSYIPPSNNHSTPSPVGILSELISNLASHGLSRRGYQSATSVYPYNITRPLPHPFAQTVQPFDMEREHYSNMQKKSYREAKRNDRQEKLAQLRGELPDPLLQRLNSIHPIAKSCITNKSYRCEQEEATVTVTMKPTVLSEADVCQKTVRRSKPKKFVKKIRSFIKRRTQHPVFEELTELQKKQTEDDLNANDDLPNPPDWFATGTSPCNEMFGGSLPTRVSTPGARIPTVGGELNSLEVENESDGVDNTATTQSVDPSNGTPATNGNERNTTVVENGSNNVDDTTTTQSVDPSNGTQTGEHNYIGETSSPEAVQGRSASQTTPAEEVEVETDIRPLRESMRRWTVSDKLTILGYSMTSRNLMCLQPNADVEDDIVLTYMAAKVEDLQKKGHGVGMLSSNFLRFESIEDEHGMSGTRIFENPEELNYIAPEIHTLLVPINPGEHWYLCRILINKRLIEVMDSLQRSEEMDLVYIDNLRRLQALLNKKYPNSDWRTKVVDTFYHQTPASRDCGVHLLNQVENIAKYGEPGELRDPFISRDLIAQFLTNEMHKRRSTSQETNPFHVQGVTVESSFNVSTNVKPGNGVHDTESVVINEVAKVLTNKITASGKGILILPTDGIKLPNKEIWQSDEIEVETNIFSNIPNVISQIFVPVRVSMSWVLFRILPRIREIEVQDTCLVSESRTNQIKLVIGKLSTAMAEVYGTSSWKAEIDPDLPRPANRQNSALFMLWYLKCYFEKRLKASDCNSKLLNDFRAKINMLTAGTVELLENFLLPPVNEFHSATHGIESSSIRCQQYPERTGDCEDVVIEDVCEEFVESCHKTTVVGPHLEPAEFQSRQETLKPETVSHANLGKHKDGTDIGGHNGKSKNSSTCIARKLVELKISKPKGPQPVFCCFCKDDITHRHRRHNINPDKMSILNAGDRDVVVSLLNLDKVNKSLVERPTGTICGSCGTAIRQLRKSLQEVEEELRGMKEASSLHGGILVPTVTLENVQTHKCYNCQKITTLVNVTSVIKNRKFTVWQAWKEIRAYSHLEQINEQAVKSFMMCKGCIGHMSKFMDATAAVQKCTDRLTWFTMEDPGAETNTHVLTPTSSKQKAAFSPTGFTPASKKVKQANVAEVGGENEQCVNANQEVIDPGVFPIEVDEFESPVSRLQAMDTDDSALPEFQKLLDRDFETFFRESGLRTYRPPTMAQIQDLDFDRLENFVRQNLPAMLSLFPRQPNGQIRVGPPELTAICILAHSRHPSCNLFQTVNSLDLWKRLTEEQMRHYNTLGITSSRFTAYRAADTLCAENQSTIDQWKSDEEEQWKRELELSHAPGVSRISGRRGGSRRNLRAEFARTSMPEGITTARVFDNVDIYIKARHQGQFSKNTMLNQHGGYYLKNRIPVPRRTLLPTSKAHEVPLKQFLLSRTEMAILRKERVELLKTVACQNIKFLRDNRFGRFCKTREIKFPELCRNKSDIVPTGLIDQEVGTVKGTIAVLGRLDKDTPSVEGKRMPIRVVGDCKTCIQIETAKSLATAAVETENFNHIYPSTGDFHARMALLQRLMNTFKLSVGLKRCKGTLSNIKETQRHRSASGNSSVTFDYDYELCEATMHGLGTLLMLEKLGIDDINDVQDYVDLQDGAACEKYLNDAAEAAVDVFDKVLGGHLSDRIKNNLISTDEMSLITCSVCLIPDAERTSKCGNKFCDSVVHDTCSMSTTEDGIPLEKYYCSHNCYVNSVCLCGLDASEESITCSNRFCMKDIHETCAFKTTQGERMYCSEICSDRTFAYSVALLHCCLTQKLRRDAIRWNDADLIFLHWKESLPYFFSSGNHHFFKMAHYILLSQNGCVPENIAFDEYYNRTVNVAGKSDSNLSSDLVMEHHVRHHKNEFKRMTGQPSQEAIKRRTQIKFAERDLKDTLSKVSGHSTAGLKEHVARNYCKETEEFCKLYKECSLLQVVGSRAHNTLEDFDYTPFLQPHKASAFASKVKGLSTAYDLTNDMAGHFINDDTTRQRLKIPLVYSKPPTLRGKTVWNVGVQEVEGDPWWPEISERFPNLPLANDVQYTAARQAYEGKDSLIVLPTGLGKSLIYIYATLLRHMEKSDQELTTGLVVTPIIGLIADQIFKLQEYGLIGMQLSLDQQVAVVTQLNALKEGNDEKLMFLFVTPEYLKEEASYLTSNRR